MKTIFEQLEYSLSFMGQVTGSLGYEDQKALYQQRRTQELINEIRQDMKTQLLEAAPESKKDLHKAQQILADLGHNFIADKKEHCLFLLSELRKHYIPATRPSDKNEKRKIDIPALPPHLREEIIADIKETYECFDARCYRAATILCGRLIETSLYYLYYKHTGNDLLETAPNIGLGKMIAKLIAKNIQVSPGLREQVHLINKVRIQSVHKKQELFSPSKEQAEAMILYTIDIIKKVF